MVLPDTPAPPVDVPGRGQLRARLRTSLGDLVAVLFEKECPCTVANFVALATGAVAWTDPTTGKKTTRPLYSGTVLHRVIPELSMAGGDPLGTGEGGPGWRFGAEVHKKLKHDRAGVLSMASDGPDNHGSQFFVTQAPAPWLDGKHTVFGRVIENVELVHEITHVPTDEHDRPLEPIVLHEIQIYRG
ncbi:MAG: peptidylprolyl isomerase [Sandaracinaceae bacterium]|nr:peptidylprolyl isomerase [Sandaracinaceae bacterium]